VKLFSVIESLKVLMFIIEQRFEASIQRFTMPLIASQNLLHLTTKTLFTKLLSTGEVERLADKVKVCFSNEGLCEAFQV
jgi:hypothetical protein